MVSADDVYRDYVSNGKMKGILSKTKERIVYYYNNWDKYKEVQDAIKKALEAYYKAFKRYPPADPNVLIRRRGIFAAHAARRRAIRPFYEEYMIATEIIKRFRDTARALYDFVPRIDTLLSNLSDAYKKSGDEMVKGIQDVIEDSFYLYNEILDVAKSVYHFFRELDYYYSLASLFIEFTIGYTYATEDKYWGTRSLEVRFISTVHAEILYLPELDGKIDAIIELISEVTEQEFYLHFSIEQIGKQNLRFRQRMLPRKVKMTVIVFDNNYSFERVRAEGDVSWRWPEMPPADIVEQLEITVQEVRGRQGVLPGVLVGYWGLSKTYGVPITEFLKRRTVKPTREEILEAIKKLEELKKK